MALRNLRRSTQPKVGGRELDLRQCTMRRNSLTRLSLGVESHKSFAAKTQLPSAKVLILQSKAAFLALRCIPCKLGEIYLD